MARGPLPIVEFPMINFAFALALVQEHEAAPSGGLMSIQLNVMFLTLVIFLFLFWLLKKYAFPEILKRVEAREKALSDAIESAKRDREEAARILADTKAQIDAARGEAQKV